MNPHQLETLTAAAQCADLLVSDIRQAHEAHKGCSDRLVTAAILADMLEDAQRIKRRLERLASKPATETRDPKATAIMAKIDRAMAGTEIVERGES